MLETIFRRAGLVVMCAFLFAGCAATGTRDDAQASVRAAESTLSNFANDPQMTWMRSHLKDAKAVLVSPRIIKAGLVFGGSGGSGVLMVRNGHQWVGPALYKLAGGSFGFQAGVEASEMVALVMTDKALNSLMATSFKVGGDASVAAGPVGIGASAPVTADILVFSRAKGLYGGLNIDGSVISTDDTGNASFYGRPATPVDILIKRNVTSPSAASIQRTAATLAATAQ
jgi:lipid-binding SYLF domain-containing protein